jgi:hypothetical protein
MHHGEDPGRKSVEVCGHDERGTVARREGTRMRRMGHYCRKGAKSAETTKTGRQLNDGVRDSDLLVVIIEKDYMRVL